MEDLQKRLSALKTTKKTTKKKVEKNKKPIEKPVEKTVEKPVEKTVEEIIEKTAELTLEPKEKNATKKIAPKPIPKKSNTTKPKTIKMKPKLTKKLNGYILDVFRENKKYNLWEPIVAKIDKILYPIKKQVKRKHSFDLVISDQENPKDTDKHRVYITTQCNNQIKYLRKGDHVYINRYSITKHNGKAIFFVADIQKIQDV